MMIQRRKFGTSDPKTLEPSQDGIYHEMTFCFEIWMIPYAIHLGKEFPKYLQEGLVYHPQTSPSKYVHFLQQKYVVPYLS
jgi:hypothetical protein